MTNHDAPRQTVGPSGSDSRVQTRAAVLDAAERLFAMRGIDGASVRDITAAAGANLGAINYHFGSKDRLVMEVFARRLEPVNRARIARLDALEKAAGKRAVELSRIVEAFIRPSVECEGVEGGQENAFMQLVSRSFLEPHPDLKRFVEEQFGELARRFDTAILRAAPGLTQGELFWRMSFLIGALHHSLVVWLRFEEFPRPGANAAAVRPDREQFIQAAVAFLTAGMRAPLSSKPPGPAGRRRAAKPTQPKS